MGPATSAQPPSPGAVGLQLRTQEERQQRHQQSPGEDAAGEVQRAQPRPDDVANAQIRRADGRSGERRHGAGLHRGRARRSRVSLTMLFPSSPTCTRKSLLAANSVERAQEEHHRPDAHVGEENLGGSGPLLAGLVNLRRRHRFGERQIRIFHHHAPQQRDEQDAQRAAHRHQRHRFPVAVLQVERRPDARQHEGRDGEHRAGGHRLADGADGTGHVLFQNRALHQPQNGHADHRRRIGGRDGHAGAQTQVQVGGAQDHGHRPAPARWRGG